MHICMLIPSYQGENTFQSGAELQAHTQIQFLKRMGFTVTVITKKRSKKSRSQDVTDSAAIYRVFPTGLRSLKAAWLIWENRRQFDIVHIHGQHIFSVPAILLCYMLAIPTVLKITIAEQTISPMGLDKLLPKGWNPCRKIVNRISRLVSAYLAISSEIVEELANQAIASDKIIVLPNGVNTKRFYPVMPEQKRQLRAEFHLPHNKKVLLFSSRLIERKGFDVMLEAWKIINRNYPDAILMVVGKGDAKAVQAMESLKKELGEETIVYMGEVADTVPYLQACDLFIFPSRQEGLPNALLEAMACDCACVASDIGGCRDLIISGENGMLFPSGDAIALSDAVMQMLAEPVLMDKFGQASYEKIKSSYDIDVIGEQLAQLYQNLNKRVVNRRNARTE